MSIKYSALMTGLAAAGAVYAKSDIPNTWPDDLPSSDVGPSWQQHYQVTDSLPNVTFDLGRNYAGNVPVQRDGHPNDTLFFWAFEKEEGSLTSNDTDSNEPWGIWLNGGPGASSLRGLFFENGPMRINADYTIEKNNYSWSNVADYVWVDNPVGTGFSTADEDGYAQDEDQMAADFFGFLDNFVKIFPSLADRPLYLTGESYAGTFIPYIAKHYFSLENPPVKLARFAIGDGAVGNVPTFELVPILNIIETYPQIIGYDQDAYNFFKSQMNLCGYDLNFTYPQNGTFPSLTLQAPDQRSRSEMKRAVPPVNPTKGSFIEELEARAAFTKRGSDDDERQEKLQKWKSEKKNDTVDPWYGCYIYDEMLDFANNFTYPWAIESGKFNGMWIPDALHPSVSPDASVFLNDNRTKSAVHAPSNAKWISKLTYPFDKNSPGDDPSPEPMVFLSELASNASQKNVGIVLYSGNDDSLSGHKGTEAVIQNTTFGGVQGFSQKPSTPWYDDSGNFAGIVHQERNWTYALFEGAGHMVPTQKPGAALTFLREFIMGDNKNGTVSKSNDGKVLIEGEKNEKIATMAILPGQKGIYYGSATTESTFVFPSSTIAAWESFIATAAPTHSSS